jgi:uncharacterized protein (TIGR02246 family)
VVWRAGVPAFARVLAQLLVVLARMREGLHMRASAETAQQVNAVLDALAAAYGSKDVDAFVAQFSDEDDVVVFGTGADEVRLGREQIAKQARRDFEEADRLVFRLGDVRVSAAGEVAWAVMPDAAIDASVGGHERSFALRVTMVLQQRDGRWLIHHTHISAPLGAQEPGRSFPTGDRAD